MGNTAPEGTARCFVRRPLTFNSLVKPDLSPLPRPFIPENPPSSQIYRRVLKILVLFTSVGVELFVFRTFMRWTLKQKGWQAAVLKMALLAALWVIITFVFAAEIYLSTRNTPIRISWPIAIGSALRDWFPWILLSPLAIFLAGKFRFGRETWRRSLIVHFASCLLFTAVYEGLLVLANSGPVFLTVSGGMGLVAAGGPPPPQEPPDGFGGGFSTTVAPPPNAVFFQQAGVVHDGTSPIATLMDSNAVIVTRGGLPPLTPPLNRSGFFVGASFQASRWTQFLHLAMMRTQFTIPVYWCIVCICWVIGHFQEANEREQRTLELETCLTQANLQALKMQLQPHFLFNTLNAISSLVHENPKVADDMIGSLSQFLRTTLDISTKNEIPLRAELEFLEHYLEIQQTRFGERLKIRREVESAVLDALVPPLVLQPLVENAIRHGIESREGVGTVAIRGTRENDVLCLEISDDGEGFSGGQLLRQGNGVGLSNTEARLQALYAGHYQFKLTANEPIGARVSIKIPFRLQQSPSSNAA